ncbi:MAG TPA: pseudouridine synthase, partial [Verrucomicrobiae bacterium]|nr:pseudouridine synthase [Verrucomicrobiae bacterium]
MLPCLIFEDEHLLVVNKPAGMNTHAPSPYAGEGLYDWLRQREPRWASLAIIHRLDKETSGVMVFSKTRLANRSLTEQFTRRAVVKKYVLLTDRRVPRGSFAVRGKLARVGVRYATVGPSLKGEDAETRFLAKGPEAGFPGATRVEALPLSGRTHQIRV